MSNAKQSCFDIPVTLLSGQRSGSRSKVGVKVTGARSDFWCAAVNIRGSALPSATKSKEESLSVQGVCLCVK